MPDDVQGLSFTRLIDTIPARVQLALATSHAVDFESPIRCGGRLQFDLDQAAARDRSVSWIAGLDDPHPARRGALSAARRRASSGACGGLFAVARRDRGRAYRGTGRIEDRHRRDPPDVRRGPALRIIGRRARGANRRRLRPACVPDRRRARSVMAPLRRTVTEDGMLRLGLLSSRLGFSRQAPADNAAPNRRPAIPAARCAMP